MTTSELIEASRRSMRTGSFRGSSRTRRCNRHAIDEVVGSAAMLGEVEVIADSHKSAVPQVEP